MRHLGGKTKKRVAKRRGNTRRNKRGAGGGAGFSISRNKEPLVISYKGGDRTLTSTYLANELRIDPHGVDLDFVDFGDIHIGEGWTAIGEKALTDYPGGIKLTTIAIPASVTTIGPRAFYNCNALETVTFAENSQLTAIGDEAFRFCVRLTTIAIPASVTSIGNRAFMSGEALETVTFAENSQLTYIGYEAFSFCVRLTTIAIPASVTRIEYQAFMRNDALERVTFAENSQLNTIGDAAFSFCHRLTTIAIPAFVTSTFVSSIGSRAFYNCNALETVTFAENSQLTDIGHEAFSFCVRLTTIAIPASVKTIGNNAFMRGDSLETVTFAENSQLTAIDSSAFSFCVRLTTIAIPASVTTIGNNAFYNCNTLERVTFADHSKITNIHDDSFAYCNNLTTVEISKETINWWNSHNQTAQIRRGPNQPFLGHTVNIVAIADAVARRSAIASVAQAGTNARLIEGAQFGPDAPRGVGLKYELDPLVPRTTPTVPRKRVQLPMELGLYIDKFLGGKTKKRVAKRRGNTRRNKRVGGAGFSAGGKNPLVISYNGGDSTLTRVYLATLLLDFGDIHIGEGWTAIGGNALGSGRINVKTISIPASVTSIGSYAFYDCNALETVTFAENSQLTTIGDRAFRNCRSLTRIAIPASVTTIGQEAFKRDEALETVTFAENSQLTTIGYRAFAECYSLTRIAIPASVTTIGQDAFSDCNALKTVTFADHSKITNIHGDSFALCAKLKTVEISKETIEWWNSHNPTAQITRGPNQQFLGHAVNIVAIADVVARRTAIASVAQAGTNARLIEGAQFGPDAPRGVGFKYELDPNAPSTEPNAHLINPLAHLIAPNVPRTRVQLPAQDLGPYIDSFLGGKTKKRYKKSRK